MRTRIQVFARASVAGRTKTRLIPALGPRGAAELHQRMLRRILDVACSAFDDVELWVADPGDEAWIERFAAEWPLRIRIQQGADIGERMRAALADALAAGVRPVLVGSDCPALDPAYLADAARQLARGADVVLGPAEDGGYVLIGVTRDMPELFRAVPWSTARVLARTVMNAAVAGRRLVRLRSVRDVDVPSDLAWVAREWPELLPEGHRVRRSRMI